MEFRRVLFRSVLASKTFSGAQGLEVTDRIMLSIAIQAALPILNLDPVLYEGWTEIIVYPGGFLIPRNDVDESGVVHEYRSEEHTSELQSLMRISYAVFCLKKKTSNK